MCGLLFSTISTVTPQAFQTALDKMAYRGPDASGVMSHQSMQLGHRRLSIIDLDQRSNQPFLSLDGRYAIIFNGEIYNFRELARRFHLDLQTQSDTEVLLALYAQLGARMLKELNGMFAFVIVDRQENTWFAARDRLGVKPLYYARQGDGIVFSSEPAPILSLLGSSAIDPIGLRQYKKLRTFFNGRTIWENIKQFPAGYYATSNGPFVRWWSLPDQAQLPPSDEELFALIEDAVRIREIADVSVGSYLSGGLDSTIVAALTKQPDTWTVGFADHNEFNFAKMAAQALGTQHQEVLMHHDEFLPLAKKMISIRGEPLSVPNEVLIYSMTQQVAKKNKVILSGEGSDELFFGYDRIFRWAATNNWDLKTFANLYAYGSGDDLEIIEDAVQPFLSRGKAIDIVAAFFQVAHLHGLLRRLDSATMLCSVEARTPFVDYRLIERMAGVPFEWRMAQGVVKAPLKSIFASRIPTDIIERPKVGFPVPLDQLPFDLSTGQTPMDRWFAFNLATLEEVS